MVWNPSRVREKAAQNLQVAMGLAPEPGGPLGNFGVGDITDYIRLTLVGYAGEAAPLLTRGNQRIEHALTSNETFGPVVEPYRHALHQARGLGVWLKDNLLAPENWDESRRYLEASWRNEKRPWTRQEIVRDGLDAYLPLAVLGGLGVDQKDGFDAYRAGVDMYEHWVDKPNVSLSRTLRPRELGYVLCRHYLNFEFDRADVLAAGRRMLAVKLATEWLENGQYATAALWLMLIYWYPSFYYGEAVPSPVDVLRNAYDDMPDIVRPF